jgi:hypothetical protein
VPGLTGQVAGIVIGGLVVGIADGSSGEGGSCPNASIVEQSKPTAVARLKFLIGNSLFVLTSGMQVAKRMPVVGPRQRTACGLGR